MFLTYSPQKCTLHTLNTLNTHGFSTGSADHTNQPLSVVISYEP